MSRKLTQNCKRITRMPATVYYAPLRRRRYFSKAAAIRAEAVALIERKYPTEESSSDGYGGWHWSELKNADALLARLIRYLKWRMRNV